MTLVVPCDCCDQSCDYFTDNFNRANANPPGLNYTVLAGTVEISGNRLKFTGNSKVLITLDSPNTDGRHGISFDILAFDADTDRIRVDLDYEDANNSHWAEAPVKPDIAAPATLNKRTGGADALLETRVNGSWRTSAGGPFSGPTYRASACLNTRQLQASVSVGGLVPTIFAFTTPHGGLKAAISTTSGGFIEIDNLTLRQIAERDLDATHGFTSGGFGDPVPIPCTRCNLCAICDPTPPEMDVTITGMETLPAVPAFPSGIPAGVIAQFNGLHSLPFFAPTAELATHCHFLVFDQDLAEPIPSGIPGFPYVEFDFGIIFTGTSMHGAITVFTNHIPGMGIRQAVLVSWLDADANFICEEGESVTIVDGGSSITIAHPDP